MAACLGTSGKVAAKLGHHSGHRWLLWTREHRTAGTCEELVQRGVPSSDTLLRPLLLSPTEKPRPDTSTYLHIYLQYLHYLDIYLHIYSIYGDPGSFPGTGPLPPLARPWSVWPECRAEYQGGLAILCKLSEYLISKPFLVKSFVDIMMIDRLCQLLVMFMASDQFIYL